MDHEIDFSELEAEIVAIGKRSRERFREIALDGVHNEALAQSVEHVLSYWHDNIRPALLQYSYEAVCSEPLDIDPVALFFSISGAGIGVHDDVIDRTSKKHNRDTVPGLFGASTAITTGDLLIVKGLTGIRDILEKVDHERVFRVLEEYDRFFTEMCNGEIMEIRARKNLDTSLEDYHKMLWMLGVDTEACCKIGAILGGGTDEQVHQLARYGRKLGYLNRLHDEIADMFSTNDAVRRRLQNEAIPLLVLFCVHDSEYNRKRVTEILNKEIIEDADIDELQVMCLFFNSIDYLFEYAVTAEHEAQTSLDQLENRTTASKLSAIVSKLYDDIEKRREGFTTLC